MPVALGNANFCFQTEGKTKDCMERDVMAHSPDIVVETPAISNIAGIAMAVIVLALVSVIWYQQSQLTDAVRTMAVISAKCAQK